MSAVKLPLPDSVVIPMAMHIGAPAKPVVKVGDYVKTGQLIGEPGGFVSAPIYASVSGTVKKIGEMLGSNGRMMQTVEIESDGLDARWEGIQAARSSRPCRTFWTQCARAALWALAARASRRL